MALTETQQVTEVIRDSGHILITFKKDFTIDAIASALALYLVLKKQNKLVDIACQDFELPDNLKFLPNGKEIKSKISNLQKFIISVDANKDQLEELSYDVEGEKLKIYITPKNGSLTDENIKAESSEFKYDLIITLDTPDFDSLGEIYQTATDFFYNTSIINIDHSPENEHYGQINLTNLNAVATAELLYDLINSLDKTLLDEEIATCLLTGLTSKTKSFKTANVTPKTLEVASRLIEAGAEREAIIKSLYRSRSLATLNLWGRVLARLKSDQGNKLIWSVITEHDFIQANASTKDLPDVIEELISFIPGVENVVLIYQIGNKSFALISTLTKNNALYLTSGFSPVGNKQLAKITLENKTVQETEELVISKIKEKLG